MKKQYEADVVIIGAGITGTAIARELSKYKVETIIVEKEGYISAGQTKAPMAGIYAGGLNILTSLVIKSIYNPEAPLYDSASQKAKWVEEGYQMWPQIFDDLDIKHVSTLTLAVATNKKELADLEYLLKAGASVGGAYAEIRWADRETVLNLEPYLTREVIAGLYSENSCTWVRPWELAIAMSDNAKQNGVEILLDAEVTGVTRKADFQIVETSRGTIKTRFIINAAGLFADVIADMGGGRNWDLFMPRFSLIVLDKRARKYLNNFVMAPASPGLVQMLVPTIDGNILLNIGKYTNAKGKDELGGYREEYELSLQTAKRLMPVLSEKYVIRDFAGVRVWNTREPEENIVEPSPVNPRFINVAIRPPGLTPAPAMARDVVALLGKAGLVLVAKSDFNPHRKSIPSFVDMNNDERSKLIAQDPRYGHVVCRCETVTEGEIVEAIKRGARTVAEVKYRTRAGMGRCQGGFCGPRVVEILARELHIPVNQVMYSGVGSPVVPYRSKELLQKALV